jgi:hypothetical protein
MEDVNQDAMMHGSRASYNSDTGGPLQIPDDRTMMQDDAMDDVTRMVGEGSDDSADDSASLTTPDPTTAGVSGQTGSGLDSPTGQTNPNDAPISQ